jgi:hypothetical protein
VHELIICPDDGCHSPTDLADMVSMVNGSQVEKSEQLGNRVLYYDALSRTLDVAQDRDIEGPEGPEI